MSFFKNIGKAIGKVAGAATKVAGGLVTKVVSPLLNKIPIVKNIYGVVKDVVGIDPIKALGSGMIALGSGGNVGKAMVGGLVTGGGLVSMLVTTKSPTEPLPEISNETPGIYTYADGTYAYTVGQDGRVMNTPPTDHTYVQTPNGSISPIPTTLGGKQEYIKSLLDSYGNPLGADKAAYELSTLSSNNAGSEGMLSGMEASNLMGLKVVNEDPEAMAYTARALEQTTGSSAVNWVNLLSGIWNTVKTANIKGVSDKMLTVEDKAYQIANNAVQTTAKKTFADTLYENWKVLAAGGVALIVAILFLNNNKKR